jgi:hypothetical protein
LPDAGVDAAPTGYEVAAGELLAGVDSGGSRFLLIPLLPGEAARTDMKGRALRLMRLKHADRNYLAVACFAPDLFPVFTQFSRELVSSIKEAESPAKASTQAFERWKALFSDAAQRGLISEQKLVGLIGELLMLEELLGNQAPSNLNYWLGPFGGVQDFVTQGVAIEVKSTLVREGTIVGISSVDQLEPPPGRDIYLAYYRLDNDPSGFSLDDVVKRLLELGASRETLTVGLDRNGIDLQQLSVYSGRRYRLTETRLYDAAGTCFPRITRGSFVDGDTPAGTLRLSYSIDLTNDPPSPLNDGDRRSLIERTSREALDGMDS